MPSHLESAGSIQFVRIRSERKEAFFIKQTETNFRYKTSVLKTKISFGLVIIDIKANRNNFLITFQLIQHICQIRMRHIFPPDNDIGIHLQYIISLTLFKSI